MSKTKNLNNQESQLLWDENSKAIKAAVLTYFQKSIQEINDFINVYVLQFEHLAAQSQKEELQSHSWREYHHQVLQNIEKTTKYLEEYQAEKAWGEYHEFLIQLSEKHPKYLIRKEEFNIYSLSSNTSVLQLFHKLGINIKIRFSTGFKKISNVFRVLFKRPKADLQYYRKRKIPFRDMILSFLGNQLQKELQNPINELIKARGEIYLMIWDFEKTREQNLIQSNEENKIDLKVDLEEFNILKERLQEKISNIEQVFKEEVDLALDHLMASLDRDMSRVDSPDLSAAPFTRPKLMSEQSKLNTSYQASFNKWANTHRTLLDDWSLDEEIMRMSYNVVQEFEVLQKQISEYIHEHLSLNLEQLKNYLIESGERVSTKTSLVELRKTLIEEREKNRLVFIDQMLTQTIGKLSGKINQHLQSFKTKSLGFVNEISNKRAFVRGRDYTKEIKSSEINWLSPQELIAFQSLPDFSHSLETVDLFISEHLEKARVKLISLGSVSDFSLESAQIHAENKTVKLQEIKKEIQEGYERAILHLNEAEQNIEILKKEPQLQLQLAIKEFLAEIQKLKNTENVLEVQMKIVRIKAVARSKKIRKDTWNWILQIIPRGFRFIQRIYKHAVDYLSLWREKLGFVNEKAHISHELSDFLGKTEQSLQNLPFVYQRLFQLTPTNEDRFFVGRINELKQMNEAFHNWEKERFVTTAIIGEKGSGISSLILYFLKQKEDHSSVYHLNLSTKIYEPQAYYQLFAEAFNQKEFNSNEEIIQFVKSQKSKSIFIVENMQHMYIKMVKGFVCQKMFFDLMINTWSQIFWVATYTTHSWDYLDKTIQLSSAFLNKVNLNKFKDEQLEKLIFKRNDLSGFKIKFQSSEENQSNKSFLKMSQKEQQQTLKKLFFRNLFRMSNGNVSLAQLYWLRSTSGIEEDQIQIQSLSDFDVSFNKDLSSSYLFALHAILVHDGLTLKDYSNVFSSQEYISRNDLSPMLEKGLLIKPKDKYNINPIIFRQVVDLLHSHNFIN
jgi:hypothetical protein